MCAKPGAKPDYRDKPYGNSRKFLPFAPRSSLNVNDDVPAKVELAGAERYGRSKTVFLVAHKEIQSKSSETCDGNQTLTKL